MSKITHNKDSDAELDALLNQALPQPPLPAHLERLILDQAHSASRTQTGLPDRVLDWIIGDAHWWRPASAGLMMLMVGYAIGVATPLNPDVNETDFEIGFTAGQFITLNEQYEDYDDQF